jgi:hypothetical protein
MKKTMCACLIVGISLMCASADAQQQKKTSVVTYYPAPKADYATVRLSPRDTPPAVAGPGQLFYNLTKDKILYFKNSTGWTDLGGGSATVSNQYLAPTDEFPGTALVGDVYYNNETDTIMYLNKTGKWINLAGDPYWSESVWINATASDPYAHYNLYLNNDTLRRVGLGTTDPEAAFHVFQNNTPDLPAEEETFGAFYKEYTTPFNGVGLLMVGFHEGSTYGEFRSNSSWLYACDEPSTALKFAALSPSGSISFNVGGYNNSNSEIMRLVNPGGESNPSPRVGIGTGTPPYTLFIESHQNNTAVFAARGMSAPVSSGYKSGYWNWAPFDSTFNLNYGIWQASFDYMVDRFYNGTGYNTEGSQIGICLDDGFELRGVHADQSDYDTGTFEVTKFSTRRVVFNGTTGYYQSTSARGAKHNIVPLDNNAMITKIGQLDVCRWNYKTEARSSVHIGPIAEDFYRLFGTGGSEKELPHSDSAGVALAGVKALSARLNAQQSRIEQLEAAIKDAKSKLNRGQ